MAVTLNTNVSSLHAQRLLKERAELQQTSLDHLSTGNKISSARDDAAGLQISNRLSQQSTGFDVASKNANDAISMVQTAEGALDEYNENLMRMRDLTLQYANGSTSSDDRESIEKEFSELRDDLHRIAQTTNFAGDAILNGTNSRRSFQIGASSGEAVQINLPDLSEMTKKDNGDSRPILARYSYFDADWQGRKGDKILFENANDRKEPWVSVTIQAGDSMDDVANAINAQTDGQIRARVEQVNGDKEDGDISGSRLVYYSTEPDSLFINREIINDQHGKTHNAFKGIVGVLGLKIDGDGNKVADHIPTVDDLKDTDYSIRKFDQVLANVGKMRGDLGASENRLDHALMNLAKSSESVAVSNSKIKDTDYAKASGVMTKQNILMQSTTSMLAQANRRPQDALGLLG